MKKRIFAKLISAFLFISIFSACGTSSQQGGNTTTQTNSQASTTTTTTTSSNQTTADIKKIVVAFPTWTGAPKDLKIVQDAMNEITRKSIGVEAELLVTDFASYNQQMTLTLTGNEPLDVFITIGNLYVPSIQKGELINLEENDLLKTYGQGIIDAVGMTYIDACRVGGVLYGLPNNRDMAQGRGCASVRTDLLDQIGYQSKNTGEIEKVTLDELDNIYAQIYAANPGLEIYRSVTNSMAQFSNVDMLGGNAFGVLTDYGAKREVVNLFETQFYSDYCQRMWKMYNLGYISADSATDTTAVGELVKAGTLASYTTGGKPGIKQQETNLCGKPMTIFQTLGDYISSSAVAAFPWSIPLNCKDPVSAMKWLNEMYTNADLMNLISWGIKDVHYQVLDSGLIDYAPGVDATNSGYNHSMGWMFFNQFLTYVWNGNAPDVWDQIKKFNDNAYKSSALGFTFDPTNVSTEMTAVQNVYDEYQKSLEYGLVDPAVAIPEMNAKMKAAGIDNIIAEKQKQLNEWATKMGLN